MIKPLIFDSYMAVIKNSIGSNMFRNFYAEIDGVKKDILENGDLSCAIFVSNILHMFNLIKGPHVTVASTINDIKNFGWQEISELRVGAIIFWESVDFGKTGFHSHVGFYVGENMAISNNSETGMPSAHAYDFEGKRKIEAIYWNSRLD